MIDGLAVDPTRLASTCCGKPHDVTCVLVLGFAMQGLPVDRWTTEQSVIAYWAMGTFYGPAVSQNAKRHLVGHVKVGVTTLPLQNVQG